MNAFEYAELFTEQEPEILTQLRRETYLKAIYPRMIAGPYQGAVLRFISKMIKPKYILEIGTFTGYSTICLASGLQNDGKIITIEKNDELSLISQKYFKKLNLTKKIQQIFTNALEIIPKLEQKFDLIFIDGDKKEYPEYYNLCIDKTVKDGFIIADNVFWNKKVFTNEKDIHTQSIIKFNETVKNDNRVEILTLNLRDGLMIIHKKQ